MSLTIPASDLIEVEDTINGIHIHDNYSGRGMYGKTCLAVSSDNSDSLFEFRLWLACYFADGGVEHATYYDIVNTAYGILSPATDSMGMGSVVYWSNIQVEGCLASDEDCWDDDEDDD